MTTYRQGTLSLTNGSPNVTITGGTTGVGQIESGSIITSEDQQNIPYIVGSVTDANNFVLTGGYTGPTNAAASYESNNDRTPDGIPIVQRGDLYPFSVLAQAHIVIENLMNATDRDAQFNTLGVNTSAVDNNERFAVSARSSLHTYQAGANGSHTLKINKSSASQDAELLFSTNLQSRASVGLIGDDFFKIRVSSDGMNYRVPITIHNGSGEVDIAGVADGSTALTITSQNTDTEIPTFQTYMEETFNPNFFDCNSTSNNLSFLGFRRSRGTAATPTEVGNGDFVGGNFFRVHNGSGYQQNAYIFALMESGGTTTSTLPIELQFATTNALTAVTRFTLQADGTLRPGADNTYSFGNATYRWSAIWAANGTIQTSDERDKDILGGISDFAGNMIDEIDPILFKWKVGSHEYLEEPAYEGQEPHNQDEIDNPKTDIIPNPIYKHTKEGKRKHTGFRAQDIQSFFKENDIDFGAWGMSDVDDEDSSQWVRPDQLIPVLWQSLKETRQQVRDLQQQVDDLKA